MQYPLSTHALLMQYTFRFHALLIHQCLPSIALFSHTDTGLTCCWMGRVQKVPTSHCKSLFWSGPTQPLLLPVTVSLYHRATASLCHCNVITLPEVSLCHCVFVSLWSSGVPLVYRETHTKRPYWHWLTSLWNLFPCLHALPAGATL